MLSLPARGVWIEIYRKFENRIRMSASLPARGVWIEMDSVTVNNTGKQVTPRKGSVD